ncbi:MAG: thiol peroxidase [Actinomycetia bacterium]|nr:thiol peroxidase [Actinomycetes bacterium]
MATVTLRGNPVTTYGELPAVGSQAPDATLLTSDLEERTISSLRGKRVVLNIFPSIDTGVCATSVRRFNEHAAKLENTRVVCVSVDLPFALGRFCGAEGIDNVGTVSAFRSDFGTTYGVTITDSPMRGLLTRAVVVINEEGTVVHTELVPEIGQEPDYQAALAALS